MASTNVIFNLADTSGTEIVGEGKVKDRLAKRSSFMNKLTIHTYDLWPLLTDPDRTTLYRTGTGDEVAQAEVKRACNRASKIILAMHGPRSGVDFGVINDVGGELGDLGASDNSDVPNTTAHSKRITLSTVAELLGRFIDMGRSNYLALLVCYAARSGRPAAEHVIGNSIDWSDSFACELFRALCQNASADQKMSARLGQHALQDRTGKSEVQTEEAIMSEIAVTGMNMAEDQETLKSLAVGEQGVFMDFYAALEQSKNPVGYQEFLDQMEGIIDSLDEGDERQLLKRVYDAKVHSIKKKNVAVGTGKIVYKYASRWDRIDIYFDQKNGLFGTHSLTHLARVNVSSGSAAFF